MRSFCHAGDIGDLIYGLYVMKKLDGGKLFVGTKTDLGSQLQPREGITYEVLLALMPLLKTQGYVRGVQWMEHPPFVDYDLNNFRRHWLGQLKGTGRYTHLLEMHCKAFDVDLDWNEPWLNVPAKRVASVVIARSARQHSHRFPWKKVIEKYKGDCVFVGLEAEHSAFCNNFGLVPWFKTLHFLSLAEVINACDLFVGNSSAPLAVAEALKKRVVQETSLETLEMAHTVCTRKGHVMWDEVTPLPEV